MDKYFHRKLYCTCDYLSELGLDLTHVSKRGPDKKKDNKVQHNIMHCLSHWRRWVSYKSPLGFFQQFLRLTHWGRVTHICVDKLTIIGSDNGLSPGRRQLSHYLNQCWNIVNWTLRNKLQWNLNRNSNIFIHENAFESVVCEMATILSRPQCVKSREIMHAPTYWLFSR